MAVSRINEAGLNVNQYGNRNLIINGAMKVAQRGTSSTGLGASAGYFTVDRYNSAFSGTAGRLTMTQDSSAPSGFANSVKLDVTTADTSVAAGEYFIFQQRIEGQNLQQFAKGTSDAKPFAVSFYVKGNASATYVAELYDSDNSRHINKTFSVTTDWTRVELFFSADTTGAFNDDNASSLELNIWLHAGTNFTSGSLQTTWGTTSQTSRAVGISSIFDSTDRTFFLTGVQLEVGDTATDFEHRTFDDELRRCKRYFESKSFTTFVEIGYSNGTTSAHCILPYLEKRAAPTVTLPTAGQSTNQLTFRTPTGSNPSTTGSNTAYDLTTTQGRIQGASYAGLTAGGVSSLYLNGTASIKFDAEL